MGKRLVDRKTTAAALGISRQRLEVLIREGRIEEGEDGIDLAKAKTMYKANIDPAYRASWLARQAAASGTSATAHKRGKRGSASVVAVVPVEPSSICDFAEARARREHARAQLAELSYGHRASELVSRDMVAAKAFAAARALRDRLLKFPARIANVVPPEAMAILTIEVEQIIREMEEDAARIAEETRI